MVKNQIFAALLCGTGFTALLLLLINVSVLSPVLSIFLLPGGILSGLIVKSEELGPPPLVFAANALVYSLVVYAGVSVFGRNITREKIRFVTNRLVLPVVVLVGLISIPSLNPLSPRGMEALARQESTLQQALPLSVKLEEARDVLRSNRVQFHEETKTSPAVILARQDKNITAATGDRVIYAHLETQAAQFPCGYAIQVVLLFGQDGKMLDQYVHRVRRCP